MAEVNEQGWKILGGRNLVFWEIEMRSPWII